MIHQDDSNQEKINPSRLIFPLMYLTGVVLYSMGIISIFFNWRLGITLILFHMSVIVSIGMYKYGICNIRRLFGGIFFYIIIMYLIWFIYPL